MVFKIKKGFTLVELLVVVAILGVLAAVGIVSFGGFLGNAKENAVKTNHNNIVSYIQSSIMKCSIGESSISGKNVYGYDTTLDCKDINQGSSITVANWFVVNFIGEKWKNPYDNSDNATHQKNINSNTCNNAVLGTTNLSGSNSMDEVGSTINIVSKYKNNNSSCLSSSVVLE